MRRGASIVFLAAMLLGARLVAACGSASPSGSSSGASGATPFSGTAACSDGVRSSDETGIDCGGACRGCTGAACTTDSECNTSCVLGHCAAPASKTCGVGTSRKCDLTAACELDADCASDVCGDGRCVPLTADAHSDGRRDASESGVDCGGSIRKTAPCPENQDCIISDDCMGLCETGKCSAPGSQDMKQNNGETDVDCGGPKAPGCRVGKTCVSNDDCALIYCPAPDDASSPRVCVQPRNDDTIQNGTESDIDCGGGAPTNAPRCALGRTCQVDGDCADHGGCNYLHKCVEAPSCRPHQGGDTCSGGNSCCTTQLVSGFMDNEHPGRSVYLDRYEITSGRVRAFIEALTAQYGQPDVKRWIAENRPSLGWQTAWEKWLPTSASGDSVGIDHVTSGHDIGTSGSAGTNAIFGRQLYVYVHGHNCTLEGVPTSTTCASDGVCGANGRCNLSTRKCEGFSSGYPTYWYPDDVMLASPNNASLPRTVTKDELDAKAMTCIPNAVLAAFCVWDGGQLATDVVLDYVGTRATIAGTGFPGTYNKYTGGTAPDPAIYNVSSDAGLLTYPRAYFQTGLDPYDGVGRIAPPGAVSADVVSYMGSSWYDLVGNVQEVALHKGAGTYYFDLLFKGIGYTSARAAGNNDVYPTGNITFPEYKAGYSGGRCMRFRTP